MADIYNSVFVIKCNNALRWGPTPAYCFKRSFSTAPELASEETGRGVKVGKASEIGFMRRCPEVPPPREDGEMRGTAADREAKKGLESCRRFDAEPKRQKMKS